MRPRPCVVVVHAPDQTYAITTTRTLAGATWQVFRLRRLMPHLAWGIRDLHLHPDAVRAASGEERP